MSFAVVLLRCRVAGVAIALFDSSFGGGVVPEGFGHGSPYDSGMIRNSGSDSDSELWFASLCRVASAQKHRGQRGPATLVPKAQSQCQRFNRSESQQQTVSKSGSL